MRCLISSTSAASLLHRRNCRNSVGIHLPQLLFGTCTPCGQGQLLLLRVLRGEQIVAMERDEEAELDRLWNFVQGEIPGASTVSASVSCKFSILENKLLDLSVGLRRTGAGNYQICDGHDTEIVTLNLRFRVQDAILEAFEMLVACPTLTDLSLSFPFEDDQYFPPSQTLPTNRLVLHLFAVVRTSRSLTTLDISFAAGATFRCDRVEEDDSGWYNVSLDTYPESFFYATLPTLLRDNPLFEKLTFYRGRTPQSSTAFCFTRNPNLNSCALTTLRYNKWGHCCFPLRNVVRLFKPVVQGEPLNVNVLREMRELVIKTNPLDRRCGSCSFAIADMVKQNSTLERLEVDEYVFHHTDTFSYTARALACNQSLQDLGFRCTTADFKQLVRVFVPDASGCQANTSLSTLKLTFPKKTKVKDCMIVLGQLVASNTTLKHVELSLDLLNARRREKDRQQRIRGKLEQMLDNELSRNTCLQTLCVGAWQLVRVSASDEWEMSFKGPCLGLREFVVKVKMPWRSTHTRSLKRFWSRW